MRLRHVVRSALLSLFLGSPLAALDPSQVLFYAPFDGGLKARIAKGSPDALQGIVPQYVDGVRGQGVKVGKSTWGETQELPLVRMPVDVGLWRSYGNKESLGPLRYHAKGNINDREGTVSLWYSPRGWEIPNSRDHFVANLGMKDSLALAYFTYFGCLSFQNSVGENTYKRCIGYVPTEVYAPGGTRDKWSNLTFSWREDFMKLWINGKPFATVAEEVVPLRSPSRELRFGSGDYQEAGFDDVVVLAQAAGDAEAKALYNRNAGSARPGFVSVPPIAAPAIDGKVTPDAEWQDAASFKSWADSLLGVANRDNTTVKVGHDESNLYVALLWPIPEKFRAERTKYVGSPLKVTTKDRDADLSQDDYAGVCLSPPGSSDVYFLGINGGRAVRDEKSGDASWNGDLKVNQAWDENNWVVEFAVPLASFGVTPSEGAEWGVNFVHGAKQVENLDSLWFYQPAQIRPLAKMRLSSQKVAVQVADLGDLGEGSFSLKAQVQNNGADSLTCESEVRISEEDKTLFGPEKQTLTLAPGQSKPVVSTFALSKPVCGEVTLNLRTSNGLPLLNYTLPFVFSRDLRLEGQYVPTPQILQTVVDFGSTSTLSKATGGQVRIAPAGGGKPLIMKPLPSFARVREILDLDCRSLPIGSYDVVAELTVGASSITLKDSFEKTAPPEWLGNKLGLSDRVPAPWIPLRMRSSGSAKANSELAISCWGRTYTYGIGGLPSQVNVLGEDILAGPARVMAIVGGKTLSVPQGTLRVAQAKDARVSFRSTARLRGLQVDSDACLEFDGFSWNTIRLSSPQQATVDSLALEVPLKPEYATLWWPAEYVPSGPGGDAPRTPYTSDPINGMRLGDEEHGLQFSFETFKDWVVDPGKGQQLLPGEKEYVVRFNLIAKPTKVARPLEFSLGLQALPVKPRSPHFRLLNADADWSGALEPNQVKPYLERTGKLFNVSPIYTEGWSRHWNYLNFWNEEVFEKEYIENQKKGWKQAWDSSRNTLCMYLNVTASDANTPEYRRYRFEWRPVPGEAVSFAADPATRDKVAFASVCVGAQSYTDFYMWCLDRTVKTLSDNGKIPLHAYLDNSGMLYCANYLHGCTKEGHVGVLAHREYVKRLYSVLKSVNPLNQVLIHCSGDNRMSSWSFSDIMIEGEQMSSYYMNRLANDPSLPKNYTKLLTLAKARSQFQPLAYGPERMYLYQFWGWNKSEPYEAAPARAHLWGLMMVHDSPCWAAGNMANIVKAIEELPWDDKVEFLPYWRQGTGLEVTSSTKPVAASGWRRGDGNLLVMVLNDSDKADSCQVKLDFRKFGFKPGPVKCRDYGHGGLPYPDSEKPQEVKESTIEPGSGVAVDIGERSYRLLRFFQ